MKLDTDPMGWEEAETTIARSQKTYGVFLSISNNLEFTGEAKDFLEQNYQLYGVQVDVELVKEIKHPKTDEWQLSYRGFFDFTSRNIKDNRLRIDVEEGGLREILVSQRKEKYELDRTTDIKGNPIAPLNNDTLTTEGRKIYLLSKLNNEDEVSNFTINSGYWSSNEYREAFRPAPLTITANSDTENMGSPIEMIDRHGEHSDVSAGTKFFVLADRDRGKTELKINLSFTIKEVRFSYNPDGRDMKVKLRRYTKESETNEFVFAQDWDLINVGDPKANEGNTFSTPEGGFELELSDVNNTEIKQGDSFGLYFYTRGQYGDALLIEDGHMDVDVENYYCSLSWAEDSFFERTSFKFLPSLKVGERLFEIYNGKKNFRSNLLQSGIWKELGFTCGGWIRNLRKEVEVKDDFGNVTGYMDKEWPLTINFEDFYKSIHAIEPVGYGIVTEGNKQYLAFEKLRYFFQQKVTIQLGQVSNVERETAIEHIYSSITTGYTKGGNYEKPLGLDEYNTSINYITPITKGMVSTYEVLGSSRTDSYGVEQPRRMQFEDYPDEDTEYDKDNYLIDAKLLHTSQGKNIYRVRTWEDDFEKAPTGIYSPETAFNLRISPKRNLLRHGYWINAATVKHPSDKIRYTSSQGNSELETKLIGNPEVKENSDVVIQDLANPIFEHEWVSFEVPFTQELLDQLQGRTKIGEELVNNYYGQVEFINEQGQKERGYLFSATIKDKITFELLKAYG